MHENSFDLNASLILKVGVFSSLLETLQFFPIHDYPIRQHIANHSGNMWGGAVVAGIGAYLFGLSHIVLIKCFEIIDRGEDTLFWLSFFYVLYYFLKA